MKEGNIMRLKIITTLILCLLLLFVCGCSTNTAYIIRNDIKMEDLEFIYEGTEQRTDISLKDMYSVLGQPYSSHGYSVTEYTYFFEEGGVQIKFDNQDQFLGAKMFLLENEPEPTPFEIGEVEIDEDKYKMEKRNDISESEIVFIGEDTTSVEVQKMLGAPHGSVSHWEAETRTDVYYYNMTTGNVLKITYERYGVILQAWVEDKKGNLIEALILQE